MESLETGANLGDLGGFWGRAWGLGIGEERESRGGRGAEAS
jgi:hypothetical protein